MRRVLLSLALAVLGTTALAFVVERSGVLSRDGSLVTGGGSDPAFIGSMSVFSALLFVAPPAFLALRLYRGKRRAIVVAAASTIPTLLFIGLGSALSRAQTDALQVVSYSQIVPLSVALGTGLLFLLMSHLRQVARQKGLKRYR